MDRVPPASLDVPPGEAVEVCTAIASLSDFGTETGLGGAISICGGFSELPACIPDGSGAFGGRTSDRAAPFFGWLTGRGIWDCGFIALGIGVEGIVASGIDGLAGEAEGIDWAAGIEGGLLVGFSGATVIDGLTRIMGDAPGPWGAVAD